MVRIMFFILFYGLIKTQAQSVFLDSIFYNIPFSIDIRATYNLLKNDKRFILYSADTASAYGYHSISFTTSLKNSIPNMSKKITYTKSKIKIQVDELVQDNCIDFSSTLAFTYKNKSSTIKDFNNITNSLIKKLEPKLVNGIVNERGEKYGYELYFSKIKFCNKVIVTYGQNFDYYFVEIVYH